MARSGAQWHTAKREASIDLKIANAKKRHAEEMKNVKVCPICNEYVYGEQCENKHPS